jgi:hypothetical protein
MEAVAERAVATRFTSVTGRHVTMMLASADADAELSKAFRNHFVLARRAEGKALLERAIRDGSLRADLDVEVALDLLYGPLFCRLLVGHAPLDAFHGARLRRDTAWARCAQHQLITEHRRLRR